MSRPYLIATLGYPGSGKTYFSEHLARQEGFFHLNADRERLALFKKPQYTSEEHQVLSKAMDRSAEELLKKGISVIYDVNFNRAIQRKRIQGIAERTDAQYRLVHLVTSPSTALERVRTRGRDATEDPELYRPIDSNIFHRMKNEIEEAGVSEPVITINGEASFEKQLTQFRESVTQGSGTP